jgi:hypothetical protein
MACTGSSTIGGKVVVGKNLDLKSQYQKFVDQPMCSIFCPCPDTTANPFDGTDAKYSQKAL